MALFWGEGSQTPLLGAQLSHAMRRRVVELWGLGLAALGFGLGLCLASYNVADPSHFTSTPLQPTNWLGWVGAIIADPLMRVFGLGAWGIATVLAVWGLRLMLHGGDDRIWGRLPLVPIAVVLGSVFAATHAPGAGWPLTTGLGGMLGDSGVLALLRLIPLDPGLGLKLLSLGLGLGLLVLGGAACGMTRGETASLLRWLSRSFAEVAGALGARGLAGARAGAARLGARAARPHPEYPSPKHPSGAKGQTGAQATRTARPRPEYPRAEDPHPDHPHPEHPHPEHSRPEPAAPAAPTGAWRLLPDWRQLGRAAGLGVARLPDLGQALRRAPDPDLPLDRLQPQGPDTPPPAPRRREPALTRPAAAPPPPRPAPGPGEADRALSAAIRALKDSGDLAPDPGLPQPLAPDRLATDPDEDDLAPFATESPRPAVAHPDARPRLSRQAERERQPELFQDAEPPAYDAPPLSLLARPVPIQRHQSSDLALEENARMLETVLEDYGVRGEITAVKPGPVVTLYELEPAPGLKASRIIGLADDIARSMSALSARVCTVPGRSVIGIELPNAVREKVLLRELFETAAYGDSSVRLALALGKDIAGAPVIANLAKMPHLLIAGTTGSGKSVAINTMILSLLYRLSPAECRLIMIDPKMLELSVYDNIPHLLAPVVTDPKKAIVALKWVVAEMEERYRKMSKVGVRNLDGYNARVRDALARGEAFTRVIQTGFDDTTGAPVYETETFEPELIPFIVVIVDEMADLMMVAGKEIEACIQRLAQMARASGIHLIMATQRPSVDVITGTIKANFPTRISFQVTSKIDSRTILQEQGAEQLLGMGDMLHMAGGGRITRVHGPFVSDEEVEEVVRHLKTLGAPDYIGAVTDGGDEEGMAFDDRAGGDSDEELYDRAVAIVARDRKCSTSYIQRKLAIGYNKAARLVEQMEDQGVVSPANAVGKREILVEER